MQSEVCYYTCFTGWAIAETCLGCFESQYSICFVESWLAAIPVISVWSFRNEVYVRQFTGFLEWQNVFGLVALYGRHPWIQQLAECSIDVILGLQV
jgi:hypothetical protein